MQVAIGMQRNYETGKLEPVFVECSVEKFTQTFISIAEKAINPANN